MAKLFRKSKVKRIVAIVLGFVSVVGAAFGVNALVKYAKDEQKTINPTFSIGGLTQTGVYEETDDTIYTKDAFEAKGLEVKLDFDSNVKYQVFFYDKLDKFISCTEVYTESQDVSVPLEARARLEVTPIWGEDAPLEKEIKWYETAKYANQLEIRVDKRQELLEKDFTKHNLTSTELFTFYENKNFDVATKALVEMNTFDAYEHVSETYEAMFFVVTEYNDGSSGNIVLYISRADGVVETVFDTEILVLSADNYIRLCPNDKVYFVHYDSDPNVSLDASVMVYFA